MNDQRESRLIALAAVFLFLYSVILTLAPAVREQSLNVAFRLSHWLGFAAWLLLAFLAYRVTSRLLPDRDPYLLPSALFLSGWGLLTIWRLDSGFGLRQALWLGVGVIAFALIAFFLKDLNFLRRYKYILLGTGLALTTLTLFLGTNPTGLQAMPRRVPAIRLEVWTQNGQAVSQAFSQPEVTLGRDPACDVLLDEETVSARHARLSYHHNQWWLEDLESTNGTSLNATRLNTATVLTNGDEIQCGKARLTVSLGNNDTLPIAQKL